ncbi:MAG: hypothetical protein AB7T38_18675 [Nitrospirales bacterium]
MKAWKTHAYLALPAFLLAGLLGGCVTTAPLLVTLPLNIARTVELPTPRCQTEIIRISDLRKNKNDIGQLNSRIVYSSNILPWLSQALSILQFKHNQPTVVNPETTPPILLLDIGLKKLHVQHLPSSLSGNVSIAIEYRTSESILKSHLYRGTETNVNWTGSAGAASEVLEEALQHVLREVHSEIIGLCELITPEKIQTPDETPWTTWRKTAPGKELNKHVASGRF